MGNDFENCCLQHQDCNIITSRVLEDHIFKFHQKQQFAPIVPSWKGLGIFISLSPFLMF